MLAKRIIEDSLEEGLESLLAFFTCPRSDWRAYGPPMP